jgi:hypothetical protein
MLGNEDAAQISTLALGALSGPSKLVALMSNFSILM